VTHSLRSAVFFITIRGAVYVVLNRLVAGLISGLEFHSILGFNSPEFDQIIKRIKLRPPSCRYAMFLT